MADHPPGQPLNYASKEDRERIDAGTGRSLVAWLQLLAIWVVGLAVWIIYVAAIVYVFFGYLV